MFVRRGQAAVRLGAGLLLAMTCAAAPAVVLAPPAAGDQTTPGACETKQPSATATSTEVGGTVEVSGDCFPARSEGRVEIFIQGELNSQLSQDVVTEGGRSVHASFKPTEAGEYQAVIEIGGETATATFTVSSSEEPTGPPTEEPTEPPEEEPSPGDGGGDDDTGGDEDPGGDDGTGGDNGTGGDDTGGDDDTGSDDGTGGNDGSDGGTGGDDGSDNATGNSNTGGGDADDGGAGDGGAGDGSADGDGGADEGNGAGSESDTDGNGSGEDAGSGSSGAGDSSGDDSDQDDGSEPDVDEDTPAPSAGEKPNPPSHKPGSSATEDPDSTTDNDPATTPEHTQEQEEAAALAVLMTSLFAHGVSDGEAGLSPAEVEAELSDDGSASGEDGASDDSGASDDDGEELAATGTNVTVPAALAGLTLIGGAGLVWHQRRRRD